MFKFIEVFGLVHFYCLGQTEESGLRRRLDGEVQKNWMCSWTHGLISGVFISSLTKKHSEMLDLRTLPAVFHWHSETALMTTPSYSFTFRKSLIMK